MNEIIEAFQKVNSEATLAAFTTQFKLSKIKDESWSANYAGVVNGTKVEVSERWWDTSRPYSVQRDQHEASLSINGSVVHSVRFTGES